MSPASFRGERGRRLMHDRGGNMKHALMVVCLVSGVACSGSHIGDDAGSGGDGPDATMDAAAVVGTDAFISPDTGLDSPPAQDASSVVVCGAAVCGAGESCCLTNGTCVADLASCPRDPARPTGCVSHADCAADELCWSEELLCFGPGECRRRDEASCGALEPPACGCDGVTYANRCAASRAGVRASRAGGACGGTGGTMRDPAPTPCGRDSDCDGTSCCFVTGLCLPPDCPDCCFGVTPPHRWPCRSDGYCQSFVTANPLRWFCDADACDAPGACLERRTDCDGRLDPVCGCDGSTYTNRCALQAVGIRMAHVGECGTTG